MNDRMLNKLAELITREYERHYQPKGFSLINSLLHNPAVYAAIMQDYGAQAEREIAWEDANEAWEAANPTRYIISKDGGLAWYYPESRTIGEFRVVDKLS